MDESLDLSVVIPAYNEAKRLPPFLAAVRSYLNHVFGVRYDVLVVDDSSQDGMLDIMESLSSDWPQLVLLRHLENRGKGAAVRTGMLAARGALLLFADADGATPIEEEWNLRRAIEQGADVAVGSRLLTQSHDKIRRNWYRGLAGKCFALVTRAMFDLSVRDSQCGFKMFRRDAGLQLCYLSRQTGYLFDLEVLGWARRLGYCIAEVPVAWQDVPGSKVAVLRDGWKMLRSLWRLRRALQTPDPYLPILEGKQSDGAFDRRLVV